MFFLAKNADLKVQDQRKDYYSFDTLQQPNFWLFWKMLQYVFFFWMPYLIFT